ncbi:MAG: chromosome segregation SMC family protein [Actinomycetota bacterium]
MFLRSLQIRGFKSFADRTVLEFVPGVSVIVGPNGSGKSNLVDAISWVLGEQGAKALRGGQMSDVIFGGSPQRAALGLAEVKLVIDNSSGAINVPLTEIEISRTVFRSGESEYRIGGQLVRLLDVQELLSESGIGRALHTVVGQGQLAEILSARPEDRRTYIEEAAGIAKHRRRKERSERKLAGLDQDLLRLQDVLGELKRQLKPLKQQADMARRHEELTAEAEGVAALLAGARLRALRAEHASREGGWDAGQAERVRARQLLDELSERVGSVADDRARAVWVLQEAEAGLTAAQESRSQAEAALRRAASDEAEARQRLAAEASRGVRLEALDGELRSARERLATAHAELAEAESTLEEAERTFAHASRARAEVEEERRRLLEESAARRAELEMLDRSLAASERDRERVVAELDAARERRAGAERDRDATRAEAERLDGSSAPLAARRDALAAERLDLDGRIAVFADRLRAAEQVRDLATARLSDLEDTAGTRFVAAHAGRALGLLADLVRARDGWDAALDAALGPYADAVLYDDPTAALRDAPGAPGVTIAIAGAAAATSVRDGERPLLSVVDADGPARGVVGALLGDVYLADSVEDAAVRAARHDGASFVTREGVLLGPVTIRTVADRAARVAALRADLAAAEHDIAGARGASAPLEQRLAACVADLERVSAEVDAADAAITSAADRMGFLDHRIAAAREEESRVAERLAGMDEAAASWRDRLEAIRPQTVELPTLPPEPEAPMAARVAVETLRRDASGLDARLAALQAERAQLAGEDAESLRAGVERAEVARAAAETALEDATTAVREATAARATSAGAQREAMEAEADVNRRWREASIELERLRETYEDEDRARADLERRIRDAERLLREGHQADPEEILAKLGADDTVASLERKAELVQRRLGLLGRVNLLAGGEFEALQERHDFLARELDDVRKARRDLLEVIRRIEDEIVETFASAYRDVAAEFERLFADLFPGGEGRLIATEPTDLLHTGIEIEARPGGKKMKRLSLLSGGEQALTAMAFLFAIFRSRPSPFYLMDEVEPALDDVNLHRFLKLVSGFAEDAQVLIVTHQKRTMEIAKMLYGVSMSKDGTTKVVCQTMADPKAKAPDSPAALVPEADPVA